MLCQNVGFNTGIGLFFFFVTYYCEYAHKLNTINMARVTVNIVNKV